MFGSVSIIFLKSLEIFGMYSIWGKIKITLKTVFIAVICTEAQVTNTLLNDKYYQK